ncbi:hypothetical protein [Limimonas halophila]|uniref:hypothetical protein n=1 Tax=Limimonas halophila TaxID=1082479 RepID=UPI00115FFEFB|nr:hypothetical protein [Limimonas halophila]
MTLLDSASPVRDTWRGQPDAGAMDAYLVALDVHDREVRTALIASVASTDAHGSGDDARTMAVRRLLALRCARALGRPAPRSGAEEAEVILALVLSGTMRRHPRALLDAHGPDARCARRRAAGVSVVVPPERRCPMPRQRLHPISVRQPFARGLAHLGRTLGSVFRRAW